MSDYLLIVNVEIIPLLPDSEVKAEHINFGFPYMTKINRRGKAAVISDSDFVKIRKQIKTDKY
ncbi:MAG: hypothetical protein V7K40_30015, partial [Nostoc sp.]